MNDNKNDNKNGNKKVNKNGKYDKNEFKRDVIERLREMFICGIETATQEQIYRAVCFVAMELISENWHKKCRQTVQYQDRLLFVHGIPGGPHPGLQSPQSGSLERSP